MKILREYQRIKSDLHFAQAHHELKARANSLIALGWTVKGAEETEEFDSRWDIPTEKIWGTGWHSRDVVSLSKKNSRWTVKFVIGCADCGRAKNGYGVVLHRTVTIEKRV